MSKLKKIIDVAKCLGRTDSSAMYIGFVGYRNLGDEVLWHGIRDAFRPMPMNCYFELSNALLRRMCEKKRYRVCVLGGGTLIGGDLANGTNPFRDWFIQGATRSREAIVLGTGVGTVAMGAANPEWLLKWKIYLDNCKYVGVRGPESKRSLASSGINAEIFGDAACLFAQKKDFYSPVPKTLGINVGHNLVQQKPGDALALETITLFAARMVEMGWNIELFVVCPQDRPVAQALVKKIGAPNSQIHYCFDNGAEYLKQVRRMNVFVGIKLHAVILALCAGVPSIMVEYEPKCRDFMKSIDLEEYCLKNDALHLDLLLNRVELMCTRQKEISSTISDRMNHFRDFQERKISELKRAYGFVT